MIMFLDICSKLNFDPTIMKDVGLSLQELDKEGKCDLRHKAENLNFSLIKQAKDKKHKEFEEEFKER